MSAAFAQTAGTAQAEAPAWWYHGYIEAGGRTFLNNPQRDGVASQGGKSLAKFYEYRDLRSGPFLNGRISAGSNDGLYQLDLWAKNVGYRDQRYNVDLSKAGEHYLTFEWDQTPHVYSTSAQTIYNGVGTNALTLPGGLSDTLFRDAGCSPGTPPGGPGCGATLTAGQRAAVQADIQRNLHQTDIGIRRDTAAVE